MTWAIEPWRKKVFMKTIRAQTGWLVVWLPFFSFPYIGLLIIPIDELIVFRGVALAHQPAGLTSIIRAGDPEIGDRPSRWRLPEWKTPVLAGRNFEKWMKKWKPPDIWLMGMNMMCWWGIERWWKQKFLAFLAHLQLGIVHDQIFFH